MLRSLVSLDDRASDGPGGGGRPGGGRASSWAWSGTGSRTRPCRPFLPRSPSPMRRPARPHSNRTIDAVPAVPAGCRPPCIKEDFKDVAAAPLDRCRPLGATATAPVTRHVTARVGLPRLAGARRTGCVTGRGRGQGRPARRTLYTTAGTAHRRAGGRSTPARLGRAAICDAVSVRLYKEAEGGAPARRRGRLVPARARRGCPPALHGPVGHTGSGPDRPLGH
jgi:hypothetical protein